MPHCTTNILYQSQRFSQIVSAVLGISASSVGWFVYREVSSNTNIEKERLFGKEAVIAKRDSSEHGGSWHRNIGHKMDLWGIGETVQGSGLLVSSALPREQSYSPNWQEASLFERLCMKLESLRIILGSLHKAVSDLANEEGRNSSLTTKLAYLLLVIANEATSHNSEVHKSLIAEKHYRQMSPSAINLSLSKSKLVSLVISNITKLGPEHESFEFISKFVSRILQDEYSDKCIIELLKHSNGPLCLIQLAEKSEEVRRAACDALSRAIANKVKLSDSVFHDWNSSECIQFVVHSSMRQNQPEELISIALKILSLMAHEGVATCAQLANAGAGQAVGQIAGSSSTFLRKDCLELMYQLSNDCPSFVIPILRMDTWIYPSLCFAADAAANGDAKLVGSSLKIVQSCLERGCLLPDNLLRDAMIPLLEKISESFIYNIEELMPLPLGDSNSSPNLQGQEMAKEVRIAVAKTVRSLAECKGVTLNLADRTKLSEMMLNWIVEETTVRYRKGAATYVQDLKTPETYDVSSYIDGLYALSMSKGIEGIQVVYSWLAELIITLSNLNHLSKSNKKDVQSRNEEEKSWYHLTYWTSLQWPWWKQDTNAIQMAQVGEIGTEEYGMSESMKVVEVERVREKRDDYDVQMNFSDSKSRLPSDSELSMFIDAPIGPKYARSVAAQLLMASGKLMSDLDVTQIDMDVSHLDPRTLESYQAAATAVDLEVANNALCQALKVVCAFASGDHKRRLWLIRSGILSIVARVALHHENDVESVVACLEDSTHVEKIQPEESSDRTKANSLGSYDILGHQSPSKTPNHFNLALIGQETFPINPRFDTFEFERALPVAVERQVARLLALMSIDIFGANKIASNRKWIPWLQRKAKSMDCKISSSAARTLLHLESAAAFAKGNTSEELNGLEQISCTHILPPQVYKKKHRFPSSVADAIVKINHAVDIVESAISSVVDSKMDSRDSQSKHAEIKQRLILADGVHLFDPLAPHHEKIALDETERLFCTKPKMDVVFIHGIRGGPFVTWRKDGILEHGDARGYLDRSACWPTDWLAPTFPDARLISIEYAAPASGWEGESLPLEETANQVVKKLVLAGVGDRPVVFVAHSMGGLIVKEILAKGRKNKAPLPYQKLSKAATGVVFYSVPHAGSRLADWGWTLRYMGIAPSHAVSHLTTGPHLDSLNDEIRAMTKNKVRLNASHTSLNRDSEKQNPSSEKCISASNDGLSVLSFSEGRPTRVSYLSATIVPHESAYPGYGDFIVLPDHDHVTVCKPRNTDDASYAELIKFLHEQMKKVEEIELSK